MTAALPERREAADDASRAAQDRRRAVSRRVREARDRLTSTSGTRPAFDLELTRLYASNRLSAAVPLFLLIITVGLSSGVWTGVIQASLWTVLVLVLHAIIVTSCRRFLDEGVEPRRLQRIRIVFSAFDLLFAVAWVLHVSNLYGISAPGAGEFALFAMLLFTTALSMLSATLPSAVYAATLPVTASVVAFYLAGGRVQDFVLAAMALAAQGYFVLLSRRLHDAAIGALEAQAEKVALIGELEQAKAKSDEAARRAEAANVSKSRFLAQMSHELRTPLNAILGFSEVMKGEILGPHQVATYKEYSGDIHSSGQHLLNLINEILDLSRIEAGRYQLNEEAVSLVGVVEDCHHLLKIRAKSRGIRIHELFEADMPAIWADERALRQITLNLLSNAIKFTPQSGEIWLKVGWTASGGQYLSVRDNGPGIPEDELPVVLSSFGQGSNAIKSAEQGAGLGLPIVKSLVDLHGGTFTLRSKVREGTEVIITLPANRVMDALAPVSDAAPLAPDQPEEPEETKKNLRRSIMRKPLAKVLGLA